VRSFRFALAAGTQSRWQLNGSGIIEAIEEKVLTPEQHNKYLSWAHFAHAGITGLFMLVMLGFMTTAISLDPNAPPWPLIVFFWLFFGIFGIVMAAPSVIAGYGLRKRRRWAKLAAIIAGVMASMSAPIGTAVCVYTFWFLFSESGKQLYDNPRHALPPANEAWRVQAQPVREHQYVPPPSPPDWR
jgi:hypothetical protein